MRITSSMLSRYTNRNYSLTRARKTADAQTFGRNRTSAVSGIVRNRQINNAASVDKYIHLSQNAESLRSSLKTLSAPEKNNIYDNARKSGSNEAVLSQAKQMVNGYNQTISGMKDETTALNRVYKQLMENAAAENSESLADIGITLNRDKTFALDETKFRNASIDQLEAALGSGSGFAARVGSVAENISKNAISTATNLQGTYHSYGSYGSYGTYGTSGLYGVYGAYSNPYTSLGYGNSNYLSALLSGSSRFNIWR